MTNNPNNIPLWLTEFGQLWQQLNHGNVALIDRLYHPQIRFEDPSGVIQDRDGFKRHLHSLYQNTLSVEFSLLQPIIASHSEVTQPWQMTYRHPKLKRAQPIIVDGVSLLRAEQGLIINHRDYFDMGQMLYEPLPFVGALIRRIKQRVTP
ncbi:nuclear transport factor 2 family protein [Ferrimonas senticii]|uniref:nuclear transport factor 2 family protein n=1 Tax=Ferrimonas senticii TaxID=394566 RepID=UPI0004274D44|nr:nuclear transport factor 2 family protein [Ferrimonas senticii]